MVEAFSHETSSSGDTSGSVGDETKSSQEY